MYTGLEAKKVGYSFGECSMCMSQMIRINLRSNYPSGDSESPISHACEPYKLQKSIHDKPPVELKGLCTTL